MARNLNLNATLRLNAKGFQTGLNAAIRSMENFRRDFLSVVGALGASVGLGGIVSGLKETATQLSVARATLKNTSTGLGEYADNLRFVDNLSQKYMQDLVVLTDSFAKFHAACLGTNFSLKEQRELYQGLTQAATFFHMSSERTENMMIAVEQMMSKGKVTAEELRRQLGNNLPGAYARVAQAAIKMGKTVEGSAYAGIKSFADFESAMKKGQIGVDVLLQFVRDLNETTKNFDTNSLQLAMNNLKNSWTEFVDSTDVQDWLKGVYTAAGNALGWLSGNIAEVSSAIKGLVSGVIAARLIPAIVNIGKALKGITWGSWVGLAIGALTSLISYLKRVETRVHAVNKELGRIHEIDDKVVRYEELSNTLRDYEKFTAKFSDKYLNKESRDIMKRYDAAKEAAKKDPNIKTDKILEKTHSKVIEYYSKLRAIPQIREELRQLRAEIEKENGGNGNGDIVTNGDNGGGGGGGKTPKGTKTIKDYLEEYAQGTKKLKNQLAAGSKTNEEAIEDFDRLSVSAWENVTAFDEFRNKLNELPEDLKDVADGLEGAFADAKSRAARKDAEKANEKIAEKWAKYNKDRAGRDFTTRDTRFDYRNKDYEILRAEQEQWEQIAADLKKDSEYLTENFNDLGEAAKAELDRVNAALAEAQKHVVNLKDAADVAEWRDEINELSTEFDKGLASGIKGLSQDIDRLTTGWKQLKETMESTGSTGWDKMVVTLNEIVQVMEVLIGVMDTYNNLQRISEALNKARGASELQALSETVAAQGAVNIAKGTDIALTEAATVAEGEQAAAAIAATAAKSGEAISSATASGAKLPFPYNLAAIATSVAAVIGALANIGKYANGGFVGGHSRHGDHNLIAANSGELVLTTSDQARLYKAIKTGNFGEGGTPELTFRLRGADIIGAIKNTEARKRG